MICLSLVLVLVANQLADVEAEVDIPSTASIGRSLLSTFDDQDEEELESELQLKKMLSYVTPLMSIFVRKRRSVRSTEEDDGEFVEEARAGRGGKRQPSMPPADRSGYGDYGSASSYGGGGGYGGGCCNQKDDLLPILALTALSLLLLYLIAIATTTTTKSSGRKRRSNNDNEIDENDTQEIELLDAPTWMSMVEELWNEETEDACTLKALCRMNRLALDAPGSTGIAVSISSLPLSYLLHRKYDHGFMSYLDASLMGRNGLNCTSLYSSCPRLN